MTAERPTTLSECFVWLNQNLTEKQLTDLRSLTQEELWQTHFSLAPIVADQLLKDNESLRIRLDKTAFCDNPDLADHIITAFWDHLQIVDSHR